MSAKPTTTSAERRQKLEEIFAAAYLERDVYHHEQELKIHWPADLGLAAEIALRLQTPEGRIYGELQPFAVRPGAVANLGKVYRVPDGVYHVVLMPRLEEYYEQGLKIQRRIALQIANGAYSSIPTGTEAQRRQQALDEAARRNLGLFSEIAKMTLERWAQVKPPVIEQAVTSLSQGAADPLNLLGLLGMVARFGDEPHFPANLLPQIEAAVLQFDFSSQTTVRKSHQILLSASEILAGQLYPDHTFVHSGQNGAWHRAQGERQALAWLGQQAQGGLPTGNSVDELEHSVLALTHLVDWAAHDGVAELAAVLLDKLFFSLAVDSYGGTFGFSGNTGRTAATTSMGRLLWGMGAWNNQIAGTVTLAGSGYELPPILAQVAADQPESLWGREQHGSINQVIYKTPDYLLCSVQDYGLSEVKQQPIWQATFGPDAVVFNNQAGRVAQWQDVLIAHHKLSAADAPGFTYFPTFAFDEYVLRDGWVFARQGDGYLALCASGELQLITTGERAGRVLQGAGSEQTWFLHLGRAAQDGSFAEFQADILALDIKVEPLALHATTLRGETIDFDWVGPLRVNGAEQPLAGFKQFDNPYCVAERGAEQMEIRLGDQLMRLDFSIRNEIL